MYYYHYRRKMTPFQRFMSDCRFYIRTYGPMVLKAIGECIVSMAFFAAMLFVPSIIGCMFY